MGDKPVGWPPHGKAVNARNDTADNQIKILRELIELERIVNDGDATRLEIMLTMSRIRTLSFTSLMLMHQEGAPVHPAEIVELAK